MRIFSKVLHTWTVSEAHLCFQPVLLQLLRVALLLDGLPQAAVFQVLDPYLHHVQQPLQLGGPLGLLGRLPHVVLGLISGTHTTQTTRKRMFL